MELYLTIGLVIGLTYYAVVLLNVLFEWVRHPLLTYIANDDTPINNTDTVFIIFIGLLVGMLIGIGWGFFTLVAIIYFIIKFIKGYVSPWNSNHY